MEQETTAPAQPIKTWKDIVAESKGSLMFVPDQFVDRFKSWYEKREKLQAYIEEITLQGSKMEADMKIELESVVYDLKKYFGENGKESIWVNDVTVELNAFKEGEMVLAVTDGRKPLGQG